MKLEETRERVQRELEHISKGARGSPQNELRMIYWTVRTNSLGKDPRFKTKEKCLQYAIERIRETYSNFTPVYDKSFFRI